MRCVLGGPVPSYRCTFQRSVADYAMQNPNEDTEWNDVLRAKGIIPDKPREAEVTEDQLLAMVEQTIKEKSGSKLEPFMLLSR